MDLEDGKKGRWSCRPERSSMKSLEKAVADYEKAKEKMDMTIPELNAFRERMKTELPTLAGFQKEETRADDEFRENERTEGTGEAQEMGQ